MAPHPPSPRHGMARSLGVGAAAVLVTVLAGIPAAAAAGSQAPVAPTTTSPPTSTSSPASTATTAPSPSTTGAPASTAPPTSSGPPSIKAPATSTPATLPPAGTTVTALQLNQVDSQFLTAVEAEVGSAQQALGLAQSAETAAAGMDQAASARLAQDSALLTQLTASQQRAAASVVRARAHLKAFAVAAYESGGPGAPMAALLSAESIGDYGRREAYFGTVASATADALRDYLQARQATSHATLAAVNAVQKAQSVKVVADHSLAADQAAVQQAAQELAVRNALLTLAADAVSTPDTDIPRLILDAYQRAAANVQARGCQLSWWGLAGIGRVESDQGRAENAQLTPTGDLVPHIIGVPLTGQNGTALVVDPGGAYAQAEGPLQFIPSTWARWGQDGNGDGVKDPNNIYDAALAAADYLCSTSADLQTDAGLTAAYLAYNHSSDYATEVLAYSRSYEAADVDGLIPPMSPVPLYTLAPPQPAGTPSSSGRPAATPGASTAAAAGT